MLFKLPDLGEGLREAEIVQWHVAEGDRVQIHATVVSVETDKAAVEIPSPVSGTVIKLFANAGDIVATGAPLIEFRADTESKPESEKRVDHTQASFDNDIDGDLEPTAPSQHQDAGTVVGEVRATETQLVEPAVNVGTWSVTDVRAKPAVRALARRHDVDLSLVTPTGADNTITSADVKRASKRLKLLGPQEPLRGPRRTMAKSMQRAHAEVAPATIMDDADVEHFQADTDVSTHLMRAMIAACQIEPALNAWYDPHAIARRLFDNIDIAIAMDTQYGLFTPVLRDVGSLSDDQIRQQIQQLKTAVATRTIAREALRDHSITLSNYGTIAGRYAVPVIVPPAVAIVGAGRIEQRAVVFEGEVCIRRMMPLSLTFDHRAVTGGEAGRFLHCLIQHLQLAEQFK